MIGVANVDLGIIQEDVLNVVQSPKNQPIQVAIAQSVSPGELPNWGLNFTGAAVATMPLIILFLLLQRYFVRGLATSGLK